MITNFTRGNQQLFTIGLVETGDDTALREFSIRNYEYHRSWEPERASDYNEPEKWRDRVGIMVADQAKQTNLFFVLRTGNQVIGRCSLTQIIFEPICSCLMGYAIDKRYEGQGLMPELLSIAIDYGFSTLKLNRIMANYLVHNYRSAKLLKTMGFEIEGRARRHIRINGVWQDSVLTSLLNVNEV